jgi:hypothetical protein
MRLLKWFLFVIILCCCIIECSTSRHKSGDTRNSQSAIPPHQENPHLTTAVTDNDTSAIFAHSYAWPPDTFSYVEAYTYNVGDAQHFGYIVRNEQLDSSIVARVRLNKQSVNDLLTTINNSLPELYMGLSKCFIPHHGLVFYNHRNEVIAHLSLCFYCEVIKAVPAVLPEKAFESPHLFEEKRIEQVYQDLNSLKMVFERYKLPIFGRLEDYQQYYQNK